MPVARLQPLDIVWATLFSAGSLIVSVATFGPPELSSVKPYVAAAITFLTYLVANLARDRIAATAAAAIAACCPALSTLMATDQYTVLLVLAAIAVRLSQKTWPALALAAAAALVRPYAALLCSAMCAEDLLARKREATASGAVTIVATVVGILIGRALSHSGSLTFTWHPTTTVLGYLFGGPSGILGWLAIPFAGELFDPSRRARWSVLCIGTLLLVAVESLFRSATTQSPVIALPLVACIAGAGFSRIMPAIASDSMPTRVRYAATVMAVVWLAASRFTTDQAFLARYDTASAQHSPAPKRPSIPKSHS